MGTVLQINVKDVKLSKNKVISDAAPNMLVEKRHFKSNRENIVKAERFMC